MDVNSSGWKYEEEKDICIESRYFLPNSMLVTKRKTATLQGETQQIAASDGN
jgi:hypothetical protein